MISLAEVATHVVLPAVRDVFDADEVTALHLDLDEQRGVQLTITALGETFRDWVVQTQVGGLSDEDWRERLRSNLVDFVAESPWGWGQDREGRRS